MSRKGTLFFLCGKMAAGKSTLARQLAARQDAMLFEQDHWVETLFPNMIVNVATYIE
jgi:predicted kinase